MQTILACVEEMQVLGGSKGEPTTRGLESLVNNIDEKL